MTATATVFVSVGAFYDTPLKTARWPGQFPPVGVAPRRILPSDSTFAPSTGEFVPPVCSAEFNRLLTGSVDKRNPACRERPTICLDPNIMNIQSATAVVRRFSIALLLPALLLAGCEQETEIVRQRVPKPKAPPAADGMLAALAPVADNGWFFKLSGPKDAVAAEAERFRDLLKSLKIDGDRPTWTTPAGWDEEPASGMRAATFVIGEGDEKLECSVIPLPAPGGAASSDEYLLDNVNRWRKQLGLSALTTAGMKTALETKDDIFRVELADGTPITWVELEGTQAGGGMAPFAGGSAPFANMGGGSVAGSRPAPQGPAGPPPGPAGPPVASADTTTEAGPNELPEMTFSVPDGWAPGPLKPFRRISWNVSADGQSAEMYISQAGGDVSANINRWRGQAGLPPLNDPAELQKTIEKIDIGGVAGDMVVLKSNDPAKSMLGAIVVQGGSNWFFKMTGPAAATQGQQDAFRSFLASVKFR